ncbi:MAG TPA: hypothetical protein VN026_02580 [Bacteroidia bacterium]|jgi:hypothetical protein|nr:hypothetical protein [Bacteroidia bacterium]
MFRFLYILILFSVLSISKAQTGYKDLDTAKYSKTDILNTDANTKTKVFYKNVEISKIQRDFVGGSFSSTTIYYIKDGKLSQSVYASLRKPNAYFEEHLYFSNGKLVKWITSDNKKGVPGSVAFTDKEKLSLHFFEVEFSEVKTKIKK